MICVSQAWYSLSKGGNSNTKDGIQNECLLWHCCFDCNRVWYTLSQRNTCLFLSCYRTLIDQARGFQQRYTVWFTFTGILYQSVVLVCWSLDALFISIYSISLDSSEYKVVSTLLMFTNSYMWCIFALIHDFYTRNVTAITSEPFSWLENGWRRSSGLLSPWYHDPTFSPFSHDLWSFFLPLWWLRVLRDS